ncbi:MAG TPA: PepSY-associated TM helix domain-containing protein [Lysobacter sp.]|nr:PepSY-associated TM helix domain-containing protein [Lysobacter sp.]
MTVSVPAPAPVALARRRVRAALAWLHLWMGLGAGLLFALLGLSGSVLTFHTELLRWQQPQLFAHAPRVDASVLERVYAEWTPQGLTALDLPRPSLPVWQGYFADGSRRYFAPADGELLLVRSAGNDPLMWLHELHTHFLAGETGEQVVGVVGWIALFMLLSGLYLWWPKLARLRSHLRVYSGPPTRRWLSWHRSSGVLLLPLLLLATLTGVGMVYPKLARSLLTTAFGGPPAPSAPAAPAAAPDWPRILAGARRAWPHDELVRVAPPKNGVVTLRVRDPREWHPNGRSLLFVDAGGRVLGRYDATAQAAGVRMEAAIYPLHIAAVGGWPYRIAVAATGLLPAFLLVTGFLFWRRRRGR